MFLKPIKDRLNYIVEVLYSTASSSIMEFNLSFPNDIPVSQLKFLLITRCKYAIASFT